jgi:hypothetical protein
MTTMTGAMLREGVHRQRLCEGLVSLAGARIVSQLRRVYLMPDSLAPMFTLGGTLSGVPSVPITAKLSRKLYETFGDEAAADMVDWMHHVDAQRAELRELNELNFARFEARLAQLEAAIVGRLEAKIEQRSADLIKWSFVFWVGAVAAVAALAGVLR